LRAAASIGSANIMAQSACTWKNANIFGWKLAPHSSRIRR
jgi:hypothetical protein